ncbi:hemerythrin domain-containing protein [Salinisphaera orenii]|uniref:hemerythrin domain-containing protein n=1 Tax=Salinisphaera orenii TaxID=856731 RepID=UPI0013A66332
MATIVDELKADHDRLRCMLRAFEKELDRFEQGEDADIQLMADITEHYGEYFTRVHHPTEDRLFEDLMRQGVPEAEGTEEAETQHAELIASTATLQARLDEVLHNQIVDRVGLVTAGRRYLELNRTHMDHEEATIFAWARERLDNMAWPALDARRAYDESPDQLQYTEKLKNEVERYAVE